MSQEPTANRRDVAIVTGGTRGIGLAAAKALAADGFNIALAGNADEQALTEASQAIEAIGVQVAGRLLDVRDVAAVSDWVREVEADLGNVTAVIAAAGNLTPQPFLQLSEDDWDATIDIHVKGAFAVLQAAASVMVEQQRPGSLITVTSYGGVKAASPGLFDYAAAKGAIVAMTRTLAKELLPHSIRVNCVLPAAETRMTQTLRDHWNAPPDAMHRNVLGGRYAEPDDVAPVFAFLAGPASRWVTGQILIADGGFGL